MLCPTCNTPMSLRHGLHGEFYYCPKQYICKQPTISVEDEEIQDDTWVDLCYDRD